MGAGPPGHVHVNTHTRSGQEQPPLHSLPVAMRRGEGWTGGPPRPSPRLPPGMPTVELLPGPHPVAPPSALLPSARTPDSVQRGAGELPSPRVGTGATSTQLCRPPAVSLPPLRMREQFSDTPVFTMPPPQAPGPKDLGLQDGPCPLPPLQMAEQFSDTPVFTTPLPLPPERLHPQRALTWGPCIALGLGLSFLQLHSQPKVRNADIAWGTNTAQVTCSP